MKKEFVRHSLALIILLVVTILIKRWFGLSYWPFVAGAIVGTILPDLDHFLYLYLNPQELTSQRSLYMSQKGQFLATLRLLAETRSERKNLIFHTLIFMAIFLVLTVFVLTSSASIFGRGLVLAFYLHLSLDALIDLKETGSLENWFKNFPGSIARDKLGFLVLANLILVFLLAVL